MQEKTYLRIHDYVLSHPEFFPAEMPRITIDERAISVQPARPHWQTAALLGFARFLSVGKSTELKRLHAEWEENLQTAGFSPGACKSINTALPTLVSYICQSLAAFDHKPDEPPIALGHFYRREKDLWVLNDDGRDLFSLVGITKEQGTYIIDSDKFNVFCLAVETNLFRILYNIRTTCSEPERLTIPEKCREELSRFSEDALGGKPIEPSRFIALGKELAAHFLLIGFPHGKDDVVTMAIGLHTALYDNVKKMTEQLFIEGVKAFDTRIRSLKQPSAPPSEPPPPSGSREAAADARPPATLRDICGPIFPEADVPTLIDVIGSTFLHLLPLPGFSDMARMAQESSSAPSEQCLAQAIGELFRGILVELVQPKDFAESLAKSKRQLAEFGINTEAVQSFSTVSSQLPKFLLDTLEIYQTHLLEYPTCEPPGMLQKFFTHTSNQGWVLNDLGHMILVAGKNNTEGLSAFFEANALDLFRNVCEQLRDPDLVFPPELVSGPTPKARAQAVATFLLERVSITTLAFPLAFRPLQPLVPSLLRPFLENIIETSVLPLVDGLPGTIRHIGEEVQRPPSKPLSQQTAPTSSQPAQAVQPRMPREMYEQYREFAAAIGPTVLQALPELSMLQKAQEADPLPHTTKPVVMLVGEFARAVGEKFIKAQDFAETIQHAKTSLQRLHIDKDAIDSLETTTNGMLRYLSLMLQTYNDTDIEPPGLWKNFFVHSPWERVYKLNEAGNTLLCALKSEQMADGLSAMITANILLVLSHVCQRINEGGIRVPHEILQRTNPLERATALTDFILDLCYHDSALHLALPSAFRGVAPFVMGLLKSSMVLGIKNGVGAFDRALDTLESLAHPSSSPQAQSPSEPAASSTSREQPSPPILPAAVEVCRPLVNFGHALGPTILELPEFAPLRAAMIAEHTEVTHKSSLPAFIGDVARFAIGHFVQNAQFKHRIETMKAELIDLGLKPDAIDYPIRLITASMNGIAQVLQNPSLDHATQLDVFFQPVQGPGPKRLNELGQMLLTLLNDENKERFLQLLEANMLRIMVNTVRTVAERQKNNPNYLLDAFGTGLEQATRSIQSRANPGASQQALPDDAVSMTDGLLGFILPPGNGFLFPQALETLEPELSTLVTTVFKVAARKGTEYCQEHGDTVVPYLLSRMFVPTAEVPTPLSETIFKALDAEVRGLNPRDYPGKRALQRKLDSCLCALLPGFTTSRVGRAFMRHLFAKYFQYGQLPIASVMNSVLLSLPEPTQLIENTLLKSSPTQFLALPGGIKTQTVSDLIRTKFLAYREEIRVRLTRMFAAKQFWSAFLFTIQLFLMSIAAVIVPWFAKRALSGSALKRTDTVLTQLFDGIMRAPTPSAAT
jgi:hypothetical protein